MLNHSIPQHFVVSALKGAQRQGYDVLPIPASAGIPSEVSHSPKSRVTAEQVKCLVQLF